MPSSTAPLLLPEPSFCRAEAAAFWRALSSREARYSGVTASSRSLSSRSSSSDSDSDSESDSELESEPVESESDAELGELEEEEACGAACGCECERESSSVARSSGSALPLPLSKVGRDICCDFGWDVDRAVGATREISKQVTLHWSAFAVFGLNMFAAGLPAPACTRNIFSFDKISWHINQVATVNVRDISSVSPAGATFGASIHVARSNSCSPDLFMHPEKSFCLCSTSTLHPEPLPVSWACHFCSATSMLFRARRTIYACRLFITEIFRTCLISPATATPADSFSASTEFGSPSSINSAYYINSITVPLSRSSDWCGTRMPFMCVTLRILTNTRLQDRSFSGLICTR